MRFNKLSLSPMFYISLFSFCLINSASANEEDEMAEMQRKLNQQVMAAPFDPGDPARVDAYIKEAMKKDLQPAAAPSYWQPGYTCDYIRQYRYVYSQYRDCQYYHRYHGRYWGQPAVRPVVTQPVVVEQARTIRTVVVEKPTETKITKKARQ